MQTVPVVTQQLPGRVFASTLGQQPKKFYCALVDDVLGILTEGSESGTEDIDERPEGTRGLDRETLAEENTRIRTRRAINKRTQQRRLAHTRVSGNEHRSSTTVEDLSKHTIERLGFAETTDEGRTEHSRVGRSVRDHGELRADPFHAPDFVTRGQALVPLEPDGSSTSMGEPHAVAVTNRAALDAR